MMMMMMMMMRMLLCHRWLQLPMILVITIIINISIIPTPNISSIRIRISISIMDILVSIIVHITSFMHRIIINNIMATRDLHNMEGTMDTKEVLVDKQDANHTIIANKSDCFLLWRPTRIVYLIVSATFARKWWRSLLHQKKMFRRDTRKELKS